MTAEEQRLQEDRERTRHWKRWGPYLSERAWGTVREDYSPHGTAWDYFPHDHARSRAYRWNEDGIAGISDRHQRICFAGARWNEQDAILKERLFGLTGSEGNHGEDVKEYYFHLDSTPTHSFMRYLYKYPQRPFPYAELVDENRRRGRGAPEYELADTGIFDDRRYFDVFIEYAKGPPDDVLIRVRVHNRGPEDAPVRVLPTVWFRNTWSWGADGVRPVLARHDGGGAGTGVVALQEPAYGQRWLYCEGAPELLFTENETNTERLYGVGDGGHYKDGINDAVVGGRFRAVNDAGVGTKAAAHYPFMVPAGGVVEVRLRLTDRAPDAWRDGPFGDEFDRTWTARQQEADEFYRAVIPEHLSPDARSVMRQASRRGAVVNNSDPSCWASRGGSTQDAENNNVFKAAFSASTASASSTARLSCRPGAPRAVRRHQLDNDVSLNMLAIALELARDNPLRGHGQQVLGTLPYIAHAMNNRGDDRASLWNEEDGFFYDVLHLPDGSRRPLKVRSMVGLIPLFAVETIEPDMLERLPGFRRRMEWFIANRPDLTQHVACMRTPGNGERRLLAVVWPERLRRVLGVMLDETEFLSDYGIRALSRRHQDDPFTLVVDGHEHRVAYEPAESSSGLFGGNSNWRGPIWFPVNYLLVEALQKYHHYLGDDFRVPFPAGSASEATLHEVAPRRSQRLTRIFLRDDRGRRPVFGGRPLFDDDPHWQERVPFHEYPRDTGAGVGASHQTGWTARWGQLLQQSGEPSRRRRRPTAPPRRCDSLQAMSPGASPNVASVGDAALIDRLGRRRGRLRTGGADLQRTPAGRDEAHPRLGRRRARRRPGRLPVGLPEPRPVRGRITALDVAAPHRRERGADEAAHPPAQAGGTDRAAAAGLPGQRPPPGAVLQLARAGGCGHAARREPGAAARLHRAAADSYRTILLLRDIEEMDTEETARALDLRQRRQDTTSSGTPGASQSAGPHFRSAQP